MFRVLMIRATTEATALFHWARTLGLRNRANKQSRDRWDFLPQTNPNTTLSTTLFSMTSFTIILWQSILLPSPPLSKRSSNIDQFSSSCVYVDDGSSLLPLALPTIDIIRGGRSFELVKFVYFEWISLWGTWIETKWGCSKIHCLIYLFSILRWSDTRLGWGKKTDVETRENVENKRTLTSMMRSELGEESWVGLSLRVGRCVVSVCRLESHVINLILLFLRTRESRRKEKRQIVKPIRI